MRTRLNFSDLDFSVTGDERFALLDQTRAVILSLPASGLATMIIRKASERPPEQSGRFIHAETNLIEVLTAVNVLNDPTDPQTPERLQELTERWGEEVTEYLRPELQALITLATLGSNGRNGRSKKPRK